MGSVGKDLRLGRIFKDDKKTFVLPMDHGVGGGPVKGLEDIKATVKMALSADYKPDAILLNPSMIRLCSEEIVGQVGVISRLDGSTTTLGPNLIDCRLFSSVEDAITCGADAVATMLFIGAEREPQNSENIGKVSQDCEKWGIPHIVEVLPPDILDYHFKSEAKREWPKPENIKIVARVAAELGADVVKSYYTGDPESFKEVVKCCPVPIIVLGGPGADDPEGLLKIVHDVMDSGAKGVIMGRNIWGSKNPRTMIKAISKLIHEEIPLENALSIIK
jgi:fructose-bisphosphate aldolase/2-amino-3,7-dideoxy-D-threo-hept-6-ulosonate synthase